MANRILPKLQEEFEQSLNAGTLLELETVATSWVDDVLEVAAEDA